MQPYRRKDDGGTSPLNEIHVERWTLLYWFQNKNKCDISTEIGPAAFLFNRGVPHSVSWSRITR